MTDPVQISVAWPYANGDLHAGHLAGALLPADIFARYQRLKGRQVLVVSGSDAHGTPITLEAERQGTTPAAIFRHYHGRFLTTLQQLGLSFDLFTHTDTANHHRVAQDIFLSLCEAGYLEEREQALLYSPARRRFLPDRYVVGTCPHCLTDETRGDQCDQCGAVLNGADLIRPRPADSRPGDDDSLILKPARHCFLDLPALTPALRHYLQDRRARWRSSVWNFSARWLEAGLEARPVTRDLDWGIAVPLPGWQGKKLYIWFENVIGYLSAAIEWAERQGRPDAWQHWWYNPAARHVYFLGKDNIPFHALFWPAQLLGLRGLYHPDPAARLHLPDDIAANEFLTVGRRQFSKSRRWAIWLPDLIQRYQPDAIRYAIAAILPETRDTDFAWDGFVSRVNDELVAIWGNLVHRVLSFAYRHWGRVPDPGPLRPADQALAAQVAAGFETVGQAIEAVRLRAGLQNALDQARAVNRYLEAAPWYGVIAQDPDAAATTVFTALQAIDHINTFLAPYLPFGAERLRHLLGYDTPLFGRLIIAPGEAGPAGPEVLAYDPAGAEGRWIPGRLPAGQPLQRPDPLYVKLEPGIVDEEWARLAAG